MYTYKIQACGGVCIVVVCVCSCQRVLVTVTCLTGGWCSLTGNADGLGREREKELVRAAAVLGLPADCVSVVDHPHLQDGFHNQWNSKSILSVLIPRLEAADIQTVARTLLDDFSYVSDDLLGVPFGATRC